MFDNSHKDKKEEKKIELLNCPQGGEKCKKHLTIINENYIKSYRYHRDKNFQKSIEALKTAFYETNQLKDASCLNCVHFFKNTITHTLENIHDELHIMSSGFFKTSRFQSSFLEAGNVLNDFRKLI